MHLEHYIILNCIYMEQPNITTMESIWYNFSFSVINLNIYYA